MRDDEVREKHTRQDRRRYGRYGKQTVLDTKAAQDTRKDVHTTTMTKTNTRTQLAGGIHEACTVRLTYT